MKKVKASTDPNPNRTGIRSVNNGDWVGSYWHPEASYKKPWAGIDFGKTQKVSKAVIYESGHNVKAFELQYKSGDAWKVLCKGTNIGHREEISFKPVKTQLIRLVIGSFASTPGIYKITLLD
jgi:hypothetical protein